MPLRGSWPITSGCGAAPSAGTSRNATSIHAHPSSIGGYLGAANLYRARWTYKIAKQYGTGYNTIRRHLHVHGVVMRLVVGQAADSI